MKVYKITEQELKKELIRYKASLLKLNVYAGTANRNAAIISDFFQTILVEYTTDERTDSSIGSSPVEDS